MTRITRRDFTKITGGVGAGVAASTLGAPAVIGQTKAKVVVVGGGFGGATFAKYLLRFDPAIEVTLVEPKKTFVTCPFSNTVIGGLHDMGFITQNYKALEAAGIKIVHEAVTMIDGAARKVTLASGGTIEFDRCVVSPGIDFKYDVEGTSPDMHEAIPHAWKAGPQTMLLRKQLEEMPDGGTFVISPPPNPFRCPPGPGERISMVAHYFKQHKPKSKIVALDPKEKFSKQGLFIEGWKALYDGMIEYRNLENDGKVVSVDVANKTLVTDFGDKVKGDVVNFIPAQRAGEIAKTSGLTDDSQWCPVNPLTFESTLAEGVHVIGDASIAAPMPKSGFAASTQAKVCAAAVAALLNGDIPGTPKFVNTCYSLVAPDYGISVAAVYDYADGKIHAVKGAGGLSPSGADATFRKQEAFFAEGWYKSISMDIWG